MSSALQLLLESGEDMQHAPILKRHVKMRLFLLFRVYYCHHLTHSTAQLQETT
jgi:hypothetical protein